MLIISLRKIVLLELLTFVWLRKQKNGKDIEGQEPSPDGNFVGSVNRRFPRFPEYTYQLTILQLPITLEAA